MGDDGDAAQARALLGALHARVAGVTLLLDRTERDDRRREDDLRRDLREMHRLIDGLRHRFPAEFDAWQVSRSAYVRD